MAVEWYSVCMLLYAAQETIGSAVMTAQSGTVCLIILRQLKRDLREILGLLSKSKDRLKDTNKMC